MTDDAGSSAEFTLSRRERADLCDLLAPTSPPPAGPFIVGAVVVFVAFAWVPALRLALLPVSVPAALPVWWGVTVTLVVWSVYVTAVRRCVAEPRNHVDTLPDGDLVDEVRRTREIPFGSPAAQAWARFEGKELFHDPDRRGWVLRDRR